MRQEITVDPHGQVTVDLTTYDDGGEPRWLATVDAAERELWSVTLASGASPDEAVDALSVALTRYGLAPVQD
jgi:hypothetical protein